MNYQKSFKIDLSNVFAKVFNSNQETVLQFDTVVSLPPEMSGLSHNAAKIYGSHIYGKNKTNVFKRRDVVVITNLNTGQSCIRYVFGAGRLPGVTHSAIAIDYDAVSDLGLGNEKNVKIEMRRATTLMLVKYYWAYPDVGIRFSFRLAVFGAVLSVLQMAQQIIQGC